MRWTLLVLCAGVVSCGSKAGSPAPIADEPSVVHVTTEAASLPTANEAFISGDCNRCHHVPDVADAGRLDSCEGCHVWIRSVASDPAKRSKAMEIFPLWERYEKSVVSYMEVPSLRAAMARLEPAWVRSYLADPHDLRPNLPESMPRLGLDDVQIEAIVGAFAAHQVQVSSTPEPVRANVEIGQELFKNKGCMACHTFGALHTTAVVPLAPDLAHTRDRMSNDHVVAWIMDPKSISEQATMPSFGLTLEEATAVRDYLVLADLNAPLAVQRSRDIAPQESPVTYAEVEERVFGRICIHCHMNPETNQGRAGPGNAGGFGWPATGIQLETPAGIAAVADKIPEALLRRVDEQHRDVVTAGQLPPHVQRPDRPGMPLGLPALSDQDIALVLGWIEQGMPE
ncbi:MAG: mono/diheme cytochrome c family protein [Kiritimatiellia bacterium]|jgi:mono/diheme cytochrome c family protein